MPSPMSCDICLRCLETSQSGEGGIRTLERGQPPLRDFQSRPFNRSGTSPVTPSRPLHAGPVADGKATTPTACSLVGWQAMLAASQAFSKTVGLIITFGGIAVFVNILIIVIAVQIRGERRENREYRERPQRP